MEAMTPPPCPEEPALIPPWAAWLIAGILLLLSGLFSGLSIGLMSLDNTDLKVIMKGGDEKERKYAKRIYPVRSRGNFLLCTLLLGNVAVNAGISILTASLTSGTVGFLVSTFALIIFGDIGPQTIVTRFVLPISAYTTPIVMFFMAVTGIISYPISKILDCILGKDAGTIYTREQLARLMVIFAEDPESGFTKADQQILAGILDFPSKAVKEIMTPIDKIFSVSIDDILTYELKERLVESGHTRIPVYEDDMRNIVSVVLCKRLVFTADEDTPVLAVVHRNARPLLRLPAGLTLDKALNEFKKGVHMAVVEDIVDGRMQVVGIVTMEDVLDEIVGEDVLFEAPTLIKDAPAHATSATASNDPTAVALAKATVPSAQAIGTIGIALGTAATQDGASTGVTSSGPGPSGMSGPMSGPTSMGSGPMSLASGPLSPVNSVSGGPSRSKLLTRLRTRRGGEMSPEQAKAVTLYLSTTVDAFKSDKMEPYILKLLVSRMLVVKIPVGSKEVPLLYERNVPNPYFSLILQGKVEVRSGVEGFVSFGGPFSFLGVAVLTNSEPFVPNFNARVVEDAQVCRLTREQYDFAIKATQLHRESGSVPRHHEDTDDDEGSETSPRFVAVSDRPLTDVSNFDFPDIDPAAAAHVYIPAPDPELMLATLARRSAEPTPTEHRSPERSSPDRTEDGPSGPTSAKDAPAPAARKDEDAEDRNPDPGNTENFVRGRRKRRSGRRHSSSGEDVPKAPRHSGGKIKTIVDNQL